MIAQEEVWEVVSIIFHESFARKLEPIAQNLESVKITLQPEVTATSKSGSHLMFLKTT